MDIQMIIVLCTLVFMVVGLITHVLPYGLTAMICCMIFVLTRICDVPTAFGGLVNSSTVMIAGMMVVANLLAKTDLVKYLQNSIKRMKGKKGVVLFAMISFFTILFSNILDLGSAMLIMLVFCETLDQDSDMSPARMFFVVLILNMTWGLRFPVGAGATLAGMVNSFYQGLVGPDGLLEISDFLLVGIIPSIVGLVYCFLFYKWIPKTSLVMEGDLNTHKSEERQLSKKENIVIYLAFIISAAGLGLADLLGRDIANMLPAMTVVIMMIINVVPVRNAVDIMTSDLVWMSAGMITLSNVMGSTGVGELIGNFVLKLLGSNPSGLLVITVFAVTAAVMTNLLSNTGTIAVLTPIAASVAVAGNMNPRAIVIVVALAAVIPAFILPTACVSAALGYSKTNMNPVKAMKFTVPLAIIMVITLIFSANLFLSIY